MTAHLTVFQRDLARRLRATGMSFRDIVKEVGCSHSGIDVVLRGDSAGIATQRVDERYRSSTGPVTFNGDQGGQSKRRPRRLSGVASPYPGPRAHQAAYVLKAEHWTPM